MNQVCKGDGLILMRFAFFPLPRFKVLHVRRTKWRQVIRSAAPVTQSHLVILANLKMWCSKMQPLWGYQSRNLLACLMKMSLVQHVPSKTHVRKASSNVPRLPLFLSMFKKQGRLRHFWQGISIAPATQGNAWKCKSAFCMFTSTYVFRAHNGVHFLNTSTAKSALTARFFTRWLLNGRLPTVAWAFLNLNFENCSESFFLNVLVSTRAFCLPQQGSIF